MKINKQLFEDVLSGKLKGTFVLRDRNKYDSSNLHRNTNKRTSHNYPYTLYKGNCVFICYTTNGKNGLCIEEYKSDIIDFIPETNMETKELIITIPEGYEIDKEKSTFEKIVFKPIDTKPIDTKPRSWEEYCNNYVGKAFV